MVMETKTDTISFTKTFSYTPSVEQTQTLAYISTPSPKKTFTPYPSLFPEGPYLIFPFEQNESGNPLVVLDTQGGRRVINLPEHSIISSLKDAVSPDGKWLAYHVGQLNWDGSDHLSLYLMRISDGSMRLISSLIQENYPDVLRALAEMMFKEHSNDDLNCLDADCWMLPVRNAFLAGIDEIAWSPDSRYLAFAAQIDDISSNLYIFDLETQTKTRMSNDVHSIGAIRWSPGGDWILYTNTIPGVNYSGSTLHALKPGNEIHQDSQSLLEESFWWEGVGWLSPEEYLISDSFESVGPQNLRAVNIATSQMITLWSDVYFTFAVDEHNQKIALATNRQANGAPETGQGLYLISHGGEWRKLSDIEFYDLQYLGDERIRFLAANQEGVSAIDDQGDIISIGSKQGLIISPDKQLFTLYDDVSLEIHSSTLEKILDLEGFKPLTWLPDSQGLILSKDGDLYRMNLGDTKPDRIYACHQDHCWYSDDKSDYVWLR
jgi:hypothetical protein